MLTGDAQGVPIDALKIIAVPFEIGTPDPGQLSRGVEKQVEMVRPRRV
jgi:hypothetical protein